MPSLSYETWLLFESLDSFGPDKCHKEFYNGEFSEHTDNVYLMQECQRVSKDVLTQKKCKIISYLNHTLVLHVHVGVGLSCFEGGP